MLRENLFSAHNTRKATRDGFGEGLLEAGEKNPNVVALSADLTESTRVHHFAQKFPERFFHTGVAEQNLAGLGAGLALSGKIPFITSFAVFNPGRNWDQVRVSICYSQSNVKIVGSHAGFSNGPDGATHQGLEDIAITRVLPNLTVLSPADAVQAKQATLFAAEHVGPVYIRLARNKTPLIFSDGTHFEFGKAQILEQGKDLTIIATGPVLFEALMAAERLKERYKLHADVINIHSIKPFDEETLLKSAAKTKKVLIVEEHQKAGGLGSLVSEILSEKLPTRVKRVAVNDTFGESGKPEQLLEKYGLSSMHIEIAAKELYHL